MTAVTDTLRIAPAGNAPTARRLPRWVPLALILVAQVALSARLFHLGIASDDEARYIYSGHELIFELWHGGGSPYYETYMSGAPVIYPVIAAMVDHVGGLAAVRLMSTVFMLIATGTLFACTKRLVGYWPGVAAAGLFAGLGLTQDLGAYASYDAMSLVLMALATFCAVHTADGDRHAPRWLLLVPATLLAANITKYPSIVFDPIVVGIAALQVVDQGSHRVISRLVALAASTGLLLALATFIGGDAYVKGVMATTLNRPAGTQPVFDSVYASNGAIISETWSWIGVVLALGAVATLLALLVRPDVKSVVLPALLTVAGLLVTVEAIHLHSVESMRKHDDFGAWFACIAAGYAFAYIPNMASNDRVRHFAASVAGIAVILSGAYYSLSSAATYEAANDTTYLSAFSALRPYFTDSDRYLLGGFTDDQMLYTDHLSIPWYDYSDDVYIKYPIPGRGGDSHGQTPGRACLVLRAGCMYLDGSAGYRAAISAHWFTMISMVGNHGISQDNVIEQAVRQTPGYVLLTTIGSEPTWIYAPAYEKASMRSVAAAESLKTKP
jgi:Dolichyl-phosphate-mannose-protein mannosyltransferase